MYMEYVLLTIDVASDTGQDYLKAGSVVDA